MDGLAPKHLRGRNLRLGPLGQPAAEPSGHRVQASGTATVVVLSTLVALTALLPWLLELRLTEAVLAIPQVILAVVGLVRGSYPQCRPIQIITFAFVLSWLGIAPVYQLAHGAAAWGDHTLLTHRVEVIWTLALNLLATAALLAGFSRGGRLQLAGRSEGAVVRPVVPWLYLMACVVLTPKAVAAAGGLSGMFSSRSERLASLREQGISLAMTGGVQVALVGILPAGLAVGASYLFLVQMLPRIRTSGLGSVPTLQVFGLPLALALLVLHANFFINTRFLSAAAFGSLVIAILQPRSRWAGMWFGVAALCATLVLYPVANLFRYEGFRLSSGAEVFASVDFDGFQQFINAGIFARETGHSFGHYTVSALFYFVPRSIWSGKATPASLDVAEHRGYDFTNLSLPLPAEMFVEFGAIGMVIVLLLLGWVLGRMDAKWLRQPKSRAALLVPYVSLAMLGVIRGPLGANGPVYFTAIGLLLLGIHRTDTASRDHDPEQLQETGAAELPTPGMPRP